LTPFQLAVIDVTDLAGPDTFAEQVVQSQIKAPFDLGAGPLLRVVSLKKADDHYVLLFTMHHIITDAWSLQIFASEFSQFYQAHVLGEPSPLPDLPIQYADYAAWEKERTKSGLFEEHRRYWALQLQGRLPLALPKPVNPAVQDTVSVLDFDSPEMHGHLQAFCSQERVTPYMALLAAFAVALKSTTGNNDVVIGTDVANRPTSDHERLLGFFVNQIVLRIMVTEHSNFRELLSSVRATVLDAYDHQEYPFDQLVRDLRSDSDNESTPLFYVKFALQNAPQSTIQIPGVNLTAIPLPSPGAKFDLLVNLMESSTGYSGTFVSASDRVEAAFVQKLAHVLKHVLSIALKEPDFPLRDLDARLFRIANESTEISTFEHAAR
jgi:hypothetical protein